MAEMDSDGDGFVGSDTTIANCPDTIYIILQEFVFVSLAEFSVFWKVIHHVPAL
jgi:hypothetical protein